MSLPACFPVLNLAFYLNLIKSVNAATTQDGLQALVDKAFADISQQQSTITSQIAFVAPVEALLTPPTDLPSLITFAGNLVTGVLTPLFKPEAVLIARGAAITAEVATLTAAIAEAASLKGFEITIPPIEPVCALP